MTSALATRRPWLSRIIIGGVALASVLAIIGLPLLVLLLLVGASSPGGGTDTAPPGTCEPGLETRQRSSFHDLTAEQIAHAQTILDTGQDASVPPYGWVVALAAALQESGLHNLNHGDRDSLGLFQQRPSSGWGTPRQITNPEFASHAFYGGPKSPHWRAPSNRAEPPGLLDVPGWESMPVTEAAQAVQRSAFPDAYAPWEPLAREIVTELTDEDGGQCGNGNAMVCPSTGLDAERGLTPDALRVIRCLVEHWPRISTYHGLGERPSNPGSDHTTGRAVDAMIPNWDSRQGRRFGWRVARWVRTHAAELGVRYIIWDARIWSTRRADEGWRTYRHPSGNTDPTNAHRDHVHVSVFGDAAGHDDIGKVVLPIAAGQYTLTARFGDCGRLWTSCHTGLDFAATQLTPIRAVAAGEVEAITRTESYGNLIIINHHDGTQTWYAHLASPSADLVTIRPGATVTAGQTIGLVGQTGNATGPHLHLEVRPDGGSPIDPESWLSAHGVDL